MKNNFLVEVRNFTDIDQVDNTEVLALNQSINKLIAKLSRNILKNLNL